MPIKGLVEESIEGPNELKQRRALYALLAIALLALLANLNSWGVIEASEARYAEISREMFRSGDFWHPTLLGIYHYHKSPLTFWLTGLGFQLFGVNAFGARFFLQLSLLAQGWLVYAISQRLFAWRARSLLATTIYLSLPLSIVGARNLTTDSFLTTFVLAAIYCMSAYYCQRQVWGIYGSALFIGLGFLTKGYAVLLVPFFYWLYLMLARQADFRVPVKHLLAAFALCVGVGLSWYWAVSAQVPGLADYFVGKQVVARMVDEQAFRRNQPIWYYPLILVTTTLPWTFFYMASWFSAKGGLLKAADARSLSLYWLLLPLMVFSLSSSKLMMYLLPIYPGIALILAGLWLSPVRLNLRLWQRVFMGFYGVLGLLALLGPPVVSRLQVVGIEVSWQMVLSALLMLAVLLRVPKLIGAFSAATNSDMDSRTRLALMVLGSLLALNLYGGYFVGANELLVGSTRPLAKFIQAQGLGDRPVLVYDELLPSLAFNLDRDIVTVSDGDLDRETQFQTNDDWKKFWIMTHEPAAVAYLESLVEGPSSFVLRGEMPEQWRYITDSYPYAQTLGRWRILYRL